MTKLKTLKDLREGTYFYNIECCDRLLDTIKQEAIKWVKSLSKRSMGHYDEDWFKKGDMTEEWLKHFFNITEEDLK